MLVVVTIALTASSFSTAAVGIEAVHSGSSVYFSTRTLHSHKNTHTQCKQQKQHARSLLPHPTPVRFVGMSTIRLCLWEETKSKKDNLQWIFLWVNLIVAIGFCNRQPAVTCFFFTQLKLFSFFLIAFTLNLRNILLFLYPRLVYENHVFHQVLLYDDEFLLLLSLFAFTFLFFYLWQLLPQQLRRFSFC